MNESQVSEGSAAQASEAQTTPIATPTEASQIVIPAQAQACPNCAAARAATQPLPNPWVYAIGDIDYRYPSPAVEKEMIGAMAQLDTKGLTNDEAVQKVLELRENAYLVREMCFVLLVSEVETYIVVPHFTQDYPLLVEAAKSELSAVIGTLGPIANPNVCNGLTVPFLIFDVIYNFDKADLMAKIPPPEGVDAKDEVAVNTFRTSAANIFKQIVPMTDEGQGMKRAVAYLLMRDHEFYHVIANAFNQEAQLMSVEVKAAPVNSTQDLADVIVRIQNRKTGVQSSFFARFALAAKFPYRLTDWLPYFGVQ